MDKKIAVIGGGAAGFFAAIHIKELTPQANVVVFEKGNRFLKKVSISGGGRCNLTNSFNEVNDLKKIYPRGFRLMKKLFHEFNHEDTMNWFERKGVSIVTQTDQCVFPKSQNSSSIVNCLIETACEKGVKIRHSTNVTQISKVENGLFRLHIANQDNYSELFHIVLMATGGAPKGEGHDWLAGMGHQIETPCPSLFSLAIQDAALTSLSGIVIPNAQVAIESSKNQAEGALLITHKGLSGPAILKLSSYEARSLQNNNYQTTLSINWIGQKDTEGIQSEMNQFAISNRKKQIHTCNPFRLQGRLWNMLIQKAGIKPEESWGNISKKKTNKLVETITSDKYTTSSRTPHKEEFVTCGGVSLKSISPQTLESKTCPGLYFAGEVLDIDAITGGFNLQAAWTTGYVAAKGIFNKLSAMNK